MCASSSQARLDRPVQRLVLVLVSILALLVSGLVLAPPASASVDTLYSRLDSSRKAAGLPVQMRDASVQSVAQSWAQELARSGSLRHNPSFASQIPSGWSGTAENVAYVGGSSSPDDALHDMWMSSAGHRGNILGPYNTVGIGRAVDGAGRVWAVQVFATYANAPNPIGSFSDVYPGDPHSEAINWLASSGISSGYNDGTFGRYERLTRAQMAVLLYRASGSPSFSPPSKATFRDVPSSSSYYREVEWLRAEAITTNTGQYYPAGLVSRAQMSAFLVRTAGPSSLSAPTRATFDDVPRDARYFAPVEWLVANGIATVPSSTPLYHPARSVTREEVASFLYRTFA